MKIIRNIIQIILFPLDVLLTLAIMFGVNVIYFVKDFIKMIKGK